MIRRWRNLTLVRRRRSDPPWVAVQVTTQPVAAWKRSRRAVVGTRRGEFLPTPVTSTPVTRRARRPVLAVLAHRGKFFLTPSPAVAPAGPGPLPPSVRRAPQNAPMRRRPTRYSAPPWVGASPPSVPPTVVRAPRRCLPVGRPGEYLPLPPAPPRPVTWATRHRPVVYLARRGEYFTVPYAVVPPAGSGPLPPSMRRAPHSFSLLRRPSLYAEPVWPQVAQPPPTFVPRPCRPRGRPVASRRGEYLPIPPVISTVPPWARRSPRAVQVRRSGEFAPLPRATPWIPPRDRRKIVLPTVRRGQIVLFAPTVPAVPSTTTIPTRLGQRRWTPMSARAGAFLAVSLVGAAPVPGRDLQLSIGRAGTLWSIGPAGSLWSAGKAGAT